MADDAATPATGWPTAHGSASPSGATGITADRSLLNQQVMKVADNLSSQGVDLVAQLNAIAAAINARTV